MRLAWVLLVLALSINSAASALAQSADGSDQAEQPAGPVLQPADPAPLICDPNAAGFRYLEVRGSGFDAWATQRLAASLVDASGAARERWASVWVTPNGRLTLEVNLCADPYQNHGALEPGDYMVAVAQSGGLPIATAGITLVPPPAPETDTDNEQTLDLDPR